MTTASSRAAGFFSPKILLIVVAVIAVLYGAHRIGAGTVADQRARLDSRAGCAGAGRIHRDLHRGVRCVSSGIDPHDWRRCDFRRGARIDLRFDRGDARRDGGVSGGTLPRARLGQRKTRRQPEVQGNRRGGRQGRMENRHPDAPVAGVSIQPAQLCVRADARDVCATIFLRRGSG